MKGQFELVDKVKDALREEFTANNVGGAGFTSRIENMFTSFDRRLEQTLGRVGGGATVVNEEEENGSLFMMHRWGGFYHRLPEDWKFPVCGVVQVIQHWYLPDHKNKIIPIKSLSVKDVKHVPRGRQFLNELSYFSKVMERLAQEEGAMWEGEATQEKLHPFIQEVTKKIFALNQRSKRPHTISWSTYVKKCKKQKM